MVPIWNFFWYGICRTVESLFSHVHNIGWCMDFYCLIEKLAKEFSSFKGCIKMRTGIDMISCLYISFAVGADAKSPFLVGTRQCK
jgi:hypothetical protein